MDKTPERIKETTRRAGVLVREQLELLRAEGSISLQDLTAIVEHHPRTVSRDAVSVSVPQKNPSFSAQHLTYLEVAEGLLGRVGRAYSEPDKIIDRLDPMKFGKFDGTNIGDLLPDLIVGTVLTRNQALYGLYSDDESGKIEARSGVVILDTLGRVQSKLYDLLKQTWLLSLAEHDVPQLAISAILIRRDCERNNKEYAVKPLQEIAISELIVNTCWFYWPTMKQCAVLTQD